MIPLQTQELFETLYTTPQKKPTLIVFSAEWCGPCKRIDWAFLQEEFDTVAFYRCDVDENKYTPGFCGIRSIPSVLLILPGSVKQTVGPFQSSDTSKLASWLFTALKSSK